MSDTTKTVYTRRQELSCTEAELTTFGNKILLENELLYVHMNSGTVSIKMGDGVTKVADLPYVVDYSSIEALKDAAAESVKEASNVVTEGTKSLNDTKAAATQAIQDKGTEVLETIPADYTQMTKDVASLNELALYVDADGNICQKEN